MWKLQKIFRWHFSYGQKYILSVLSLLNLQSGPIIPSTRLHEIFVEIRWHLLEWFDWLWLQSALTNSVKKGFPQFSSIHIVIWDVLLLTCNRERKSALSTAGGNFTLNSEAVQQTGNFMLQPWWWPTELS
jgi:hypothetical protein